MRDRRLLERPPGHELVRPFVHDLGLPLDPLRRRCRRRPAGTALAGHVDGFHVAHEPRQIRAITPVAIQRPRGQIPQVANHPDREQDGRGGGWRKCAESGGELAADRRAFDRAVASRETLREAVTAGGVAFSDAAQCLPELPVFRAAGEEGAAVRARFPVAFAAARLSFALPIFPGMTSGQIARVADTVVAGARQARAA